MNIVSLLIKAACWAILERDITEPCYLTEWLWPDRDCGLRKRSETFWMAVVSAATAWEPFCSRWGIP